MDFAISNNNNIYDNQTFLYYIYNNGKICACMKMRKNNNKIKLMKKYI